MNDVGCSSFMRLPLDSVETLAPIRIPRVIAAAGQCIVFDKVYHPLKRMACRLVNQLFDVLEVAAEAQIVLR